MNISSVTAQGCEWVPAVSFDQVISTSKSDFAVTLPSAAVRGNQLVSSPVRTPCVVLPLDAFAQALAESNFHKTQKTLNMYRV